MQMISFRQLAFSTALALSLAGMATNAKAGTVFTVQLGSFESEKEARAHWSKLQHRFPDLFEPLNYASAKVQLPPDDFVYFRTQAGPIANRSDADGICRRLVVKGFECYVAETAMFMADGDNVAEEAPDTSSEVASAPPPPPAPVPAAAAPVPETEKVDLMEAEEVANLYGSNAPAKPLPAPQTPEPIAQQPAAAPEDAAIDVPPPPPPAPASLPWAAAPANAAPASGGAPFQQGESHYAVNGQTASPAPAARNVPLPSAPVSDGEVADLKVAEAVPVPLGEIPSTPAASGYNTSMERGLPSQNFRQATLWAEVSYFTTQEGALGYWRTLRTRDNMIPQGLRLRVVKPVRQRGGTERLSLRIGPFDNANAIRRLCSFTTPEKLRCQAMRDVGSSISYAGQPRQRLNPADAYARRMAAASPPFAAPSHGAGAGETYWLQLGAYPSLEMAKSQWSMLKSAHPALLSKLHEQIQAPGYSSASRPLYRLRVGPFTQNVDATNTCRTLKNNGTMCLVVSGQ